MCEAVKKMTKESAGPSAGSYNITAEESKRIQIMRILLTVMVIFWHSDEPVISFADGDVLLQAPLWLDAAKDLISGVIARCSVPGFFFLSAVLLYRRDFRWSDNIKKKTRTLAVPYLIINTLWIVVYFIGQGLPVISRYFANPAKMIRSWGVWKFFEAYLGTRLSSDRSLFFPFVSPTWFIRDLFTLNLIAPLLKKAVDKFPKVIFVILSAMVVFDFHTHIFCISTTALAYFCFGYYLVKYDRHLTELDRVPAPAMAGLYIVSIAMFYLTRGTAAEHLFRAFSIIAGFSFFFRFATKFKSDKIEQGFLSAARYSFTIYLFHAPSLGMLQKISARFLPMGAFTQVLTYFGAPIVIFFACMIFSAFLEKCFPGIYAVISGGRKPALKSA